MTAADRYTSLQSKTSISAAYRTKRSIYPLPSSNPVWSRGNVQDWCARGRRFEPDRRQLRTELFRNCRYFFLLIEDKVKVKSKSYEATLPTKLTENDSPRHGKYFPRLGKSLSTALSGKKHENCNLRESA